MPYLGFKILYYELIYFNNIMWSSVFLLFVQVYLTHASCVCTTVACPVEGNNNVIMGNGSANINYIYKSHNNYEVVISASGTITPDSLDNGSETTSCTQQYSRSLEDDGEQNCDAGHILANRLGGYGNIPTAVAAIKEGAIDYLAKPADADDVEKALLADPEKKAEPPENPMSADRVKWEHIHRVFELCNRNVSETARRLKMHRRTLQRILSKRSPR